MIDVLFAEVQPEPQFLALELPQGVDVGPPGYAVRVPWAAAGGATSAEVTSGELRVSRATATSSLGALAVASVDNDVDVVVPGAKHVRALALSGLKLAGGTELRSADDLRAAGAPSLRLVVSTQVGGNWTPLCVVPNPGGRGVLPAQLTGASFANGVLSLPDPAAAKLRLTLVRGDTPESFEPQATKLAGAHGTAAVPSAGLELAGPDGAVVWAFPGELPAAAQVVDLRTPVQLALRAALGAGAAPDVTFRLRGAAGMRAWVTVTAAHGALVRTWPGTATVELQGDPAALPLGTPALAAEAPVSAVADLAVRYAGIRLHDAVRDAVPAAAGGVGGPIVGETPVVRALPPAALREHAVAMVAPIGRAPGGCALSVEFVDLSAGPPGTPLGPPGTVELPAAAALAATWVSLPELPLVDGPAGISVRTTSGHFLWAAGADGSPLVRLAVHDPEPGGRTVRIGAATLASVAAQETALPAHALPAAELRGPAAPALTSDLFCSVDLADLTLRYGR